MLVRIFKNSANSEAVLHPEFIASSNNFLLVFTFILNPSFINMSNDTTILKIKLKIWQIVI